MNIVHFISHFPYPDQFIDPHRNDRYVCSGGEMAAESLVKEQVRTGNTVVVVTSSLRRTDEWADGDGYAVYRYGSLFQLGETLFSPGMFFRPIHDIGRPDIVHIHHTTPPGGMAGLACNRIWRCPLVVTHHGFERPDSYGSLVRRAAVFLSSKFYVDQLFRAATRIICISPDFFYASLFLKKYRSKVRLIGHGYYPSDYQYEISMEQARCELGLALDKRYGLFVGSLIPPKGLGVILKALPEVVQSNPDFILLVLGRGPMEGTFRHQAMDGDVSENVRFVGFVGDFQKKLLYYRACDILLIPSSLSEMYCFVLYEGAAAGCCIMTSDLDVFTMVVNDHVNGIITKAGDSRELGQAVIEILKDRDLQIRLMNMAKKQIVPLTWSEVSRKTSQLYSSLVKDKPPQGMPE